jgi:Dicarboxylate transport
MKIVRTALRWLIRVVVALVVILAAALYYYSFHLPDLVESKVLAALADLGLPDATARVSHIDLDGVILTDVDLDGTGLFRAESIEIGFSLGEVRHGHVRGITVTGLTLTLRYVDGLLDLGPLGEIKSPGEGKDELAELPFAAIHLEACRLVAEYEGEIRHFPIQGTVRNVGKGHLDFELTSRFEEKPVEIKGSFGTRDLIAGAIATSAGIQLKVDYEPSESRLDVAVDGRRDRLSLFLEDRHLLGEGLTLELRACVKEGKLTRAHIAVDADYLEFDGRAVRDVRADLTGDADSLAGTASCRCDLPEVGLDLGPDARVLVGGAIAIYPTAEPIRAELRGVQASVRGLRPAGFRGNLDATIRGKVTPKGLDLEIESAHASGEVDAAPGPLDLRLGKPGRMTASFASPLDWHVSLPAALFTGAPRYEGIEDIELRLLGIVEAGPEETVVTLAMPSEVTASSLQVGGLRTGPLKARFGATVTALPDGVRITTDRDCEIEAEGMRVGEYAAEPVGLFFEFQGDAPPGEFTLRARLREPARFIGPALSASISEVELSALGSYQRDGMVRADGEILAVVARGDSGESGIEFEGARLELPFVFGKTAPEKRGELTVATLTVLGQTVPGPEIELRQIGGGLEYLGKWRPTDDALISFNGMGKLTPNGLSSRTEFESGPFEIAPGDIFGKLLKEKSGVSATGTVQVNGRLDLDRGRLTPEINVRFSGGDVTYGEDTLSLSGVETTLTLDSFPPTTPGGQRITWKKARVGEIEFGDGLVEFQLESMDLLSLEQIRCNLSPTGHFRIFPFRLNPSEPDIDLQLYCEDVSLTQWLDLVAPEKALAKGLISGRLPIRIRTKPVLKVDFSPGYLHAKPGGWFQVHDVSALEELLDEHIPAVAGDVDYSQVVKDRVVQALRNFEYSTLKFEIIQNEWDQTLRVTVSGKGRDIPEGLENPQELHLTVNFNGFDTLIGTALKMKLGLDDLLGGTR